MVFDDPRNFDFFKKFRKSTALIATEGNRFWRYYEIEHTPYSVHEWMESVIEKKNENFKFSKIPKIENLESELDSEGIEPSYIV